MTDEVEESKEWHYTGPISIPFISKPDLKGRDYRIPEQIETDERARGGSIRLIRNKEDLTPAMLNADNVVIVLDSVSAVSIARAQRLAKKSEKNNLVRTGTMCGKFMIECVTPEYVERHYKRKAVKNGGPNPRTRTRTN